MWFETNNLQWNVKKRVLCKLTLLFLLTPQLSACLADSEYKKTPVSKRIDISKPNIKTELLVHISKEDNYAFSLLINYKNKAEIDKVFVLVEGEDAYGHKTNGEKTPINIDVYTIKDSQNLLVSSGGGESFPHYASGKGHFEKLIYADYLMPGDYQVLIDTKAGNSKFKDVEVDLHIGLAHRSK